MNGMDDLQPVLDAIQEHLGAVTRVKDNGDAAPGAFKKTIVNFTTTAGHEGEIQVTTPAMWRARTELGGHALYKEYRTAAIEHGQNSPEAKALQQKMAALYAAAD
jgi:hypothetical protein